MHIVLSRCARGCCKTGAGAYWRQRRPGRRPRGRDDDVADDNNDDADDDTRDDDEDDDDDAGDTVGGGGGGGELCVLARALCCIQLSQDTQRIQKAPTKQFRQ